MTIISSEEINQLQSMFPQIDTATIKKTFVKAGSVEATIQQLLSLDTTPPPKKTAPPPKKPEKIDEDTDDSDKPWACTACTYQNLAGALNCAICNTTSPIKPKYTVPSWWTSFWNEYHSQTPYSEEEAKIIVLKGGDFKNARTLTLEVKKRALKKLGIDEVHSGPQDGGTVLPTPIPPFVHNPYIHNPYILNPPGYPTPCFAPSSAHRPPMGG